MALADTAVALIATASGATALMPFILMECRIRRRDVRVDVCWEVCEAVKDKAVAEKVSKSDCGAISKRRSDDRVNERAAKELSMKKEVS